MPHNSTSDKDCGHWFNEKLLNHILKVDPAGFTDELNVAYEIIQEIKHRCKIFRPGNWRGIQFLSTEIW